MYTVPMVPDWMVMIGSLTPILLVGSVALIIFGIYRFKRYLTQMQEDKMEEERMRQAFAAKSKIKLK